MTNEIPEYPKTMRNITQVLFHNDVTSEGYRYSVGFKYSDRNPQTITYLNEPYRAKAIYDHFFGLGWELSVLSDGTRVLTKQKLND